MGLCTASDSKSYLKIKILICWISNISFPVMEIVILLCTNNQVLYVEIKDFIDVASGNTCIVLFLSHKSILWTARD